MALGKDKNAVPVNANVPEHVMVEFEVARARRQMKKQEAFAEAMTHWAREMVALKKEAEVLTGPGTVSNIPDIAPQEMPWVLRFLRVLRSKLFGHAIQENVRSFCVGLEAIEVLETSGERANHSFDQREFDEGVARFRKNAADLERALGATPDVGKHVRAKKA